MRQHPISWMREDQDDFNKFKSNVHNLTQYFGIQEKESSPSVRPSASEWPTRARHNEGELVERVSRPHQRRIDRRWDIPGDAAPKGSYHSLR
eukprot:scaffold97255_cov49-Attheya_sp.AAC.7